MDSWIWRKYLCRIKIRILEFRYKTCFHVKSYFSDETFPGG